MTGLVVPVLDDRRCRPHAIDLLAVVVSLLRFASLGDIFGYRRIYVIGLPVFTLAALVSALSHSLAMLALGRASQGRARS